MRFNLKKVLASNINRKIIALIIGYGLWSMLHHSHTTTITCQIPLCFYNVPKKVNITAPETIELTLAGKRIDLQCLDKTLLALHINAAYLHTGKNPLLVNNANLFLPREINVVNYCPLNGVITVEENNNQL